MKINVQNPELFFAGFYVLSFVFTLIMAINYGRKRNIPIRSVLLVLSATTFFTVAGSRFFLTPVSQWVDLFIYGTNTSHIGRSAIGGIVFGLTGFILSSRFAGLDKNVFVFYAWLTPVGYGIQKFGCFFNGCCFGIPADSIIGVTYPKGTNAHFYHFVNDAITLNAPESLKVFPVQVFETLFFFLIGFIVWKLSGKFRKTGSIILFSIMLMLLFRFFSEFLRVQIDLTGLKPLQWFLLFIGTIFGICLVIYEKFTNAEIKIWKAADLNVNRSVGFILTLTFALFMLRGIFASYEKISLYITFIPALIYTGFYVFNSLRETRIRLATASFLIIPVFMILPTMSNDSLKKSSNKHDYYRNDPKRFSTVNAGTYFGKVNTSVRYNPQEGQCGTTTFTEEDYEHKILIGGGGYSTTLNRGSYLLTPGINIYAGYLKEINKTNDTSKIYNIKGINPNIKLDTKWFGAGIGLNVGNLNWLSPQIDGNAINLLKNNSVMPEISLRIGRTDRLDLRYNYGMNSYANFPILINEVSLGSGFGNRTISRLRLGYAFSEHLEFPFLQGDFVLMDNFGINLKYDFENKSHLRSFVVGANYKFGKK